MLVGKLSQAQKNILGKKPFKQDGYFNPIQDANGNWIVSQEEINQCDLPQYSFLKNIEMIEYVPVVNNDIP